MEHNYFCRLKLNNIEDLERLRSLADDRKGWRRLVQRIVDAGEATHSVEDNAGRHQFIIHSQPRLMR